MLGRYTYTLQEIKTGRALIGADLRAYRELPAKAKTKEFEALYFNRAVQMLDYLFVHRLRAVEGKDGNALVEVRVLCNSILLNEGKVQIEKVREWPESAGSSLKLAPEKSVLGMKNGDPVQLTEAQFVKLADAFFKELEKKFIEGSASPMPAKRRVRERSKGMNTWL
ncbi:MAG TPA: hypothetical protein VK716_09320 [Terracidiphilus sp.]|jgi:hypothetical protein|nr:hypothetical protein [Terracidiphilus sp.]